jgi:hypothetical protein
MPDASVTTYRTLRTDGLTQGQVRALLRTGELRRVRHGVYRWSTPSEADAAPDHAALARLTWAQLRPGATVSHLSAAVMHGLPLLGPPPQRVSVIRPGGGHGRVSPTLHLHRCDLAASDVVELDGVPVTSMARTAVDVARTSSFDQATVVADAALRFGVHRLELQRCAEAFCGRRGVARARRVIAFANAESGSAGESVSRVRMHQAGLPAPVLQWQINDSDGRQLFTDFAWPDLRTVGEFDGKIKYGRLLRPGQSADDVVMAEKQRENRIRRHGWWLVRWGWAELADVRAFGELIREAFANAPEVR